MTKTVFAITKPGFDYPQFLNGRTDDDHDGLILSVRENARTVSHENGQYLACGDVVDIHLDPDEAIAVAKGILAHYGEQAKPNYEHVVEQTVGDVSVKTTDRYFGMGNSVVEETLVTAAGNDGAQPMPPLKFPFSAPLGEHVLPRSGMVVADETPASQVARLGDVIQRMFEGIEPSENEGAVDTAIRLLGSYYAETDHARKILDRLPNGKKYAKRSPTDKIAYGLAHGAAEAPRPGETVDTTRGTDAVVADPDVDGRKIIPAVDETLETVVPPPGGSYIGLDRAAAQPDEEEMPF